MAEKDNAPDSSRREFVRVSLLVGLGAACAGAGILPVLSQGSAAAGAPIPLLSLEEAKDEIWDALSSVGTPVALEITLTRRDAWRNISRSQTVFLSRVKAGSTADCFLALSPICPHAGCGVELADGAFVCPCHAAKFDAKGARKEGPAPRGLDPLKLTVANKDGKPWLHLTWQDFITGLEERVPRT